MYINDRNFYKNFIGECVCHNFSGKESKKPWGKRVYREQIVANSCDISHVYLKPQRRPVETHFREQPTLDRFRPVFYLSPRVAVFRLVSREVSRTLLQFSVKSNAAAFAPAVTMQREEASCFTGSFLAFDGPWRSFLSLFVFSPSPVSPTNISSSAGRFWSVSSARPSSSSSPSSPPCAVRPWWWHFIAIRIVWVTSGLAVRAFSALLVPRSFGISQHMQSSPTTMFCRLGPEIRYCHWRIFVVCARSSLLLENRKTARRKNFDKSSYERRLAREAHPTRAISRSVCDDSSALEIRSRAPEWNPSFRSERTPKDAFYSERVERGDGWRITSRQR